MAVPIFRVPELSESIGARRTESRVDALLNRLRDRNTKRQLAMDALYAKGIGVSRPTRQMWWHPRQGVLGCHEGSWEAGGGGECINASAVMASGFFPAGSYLYD